jgi:hypothetical protein
MRMGGDDVQELRDQSAINVGVYVRTESFCTGDKVLDEHGILCEREVRSGHFPVVGIIRNGVVEEASIRDHVRLHPVQVGNAPPAERLRQQIAAAFAKVHVETRPCLQAMCDEMAEGREFLGGRFTVRGGLAFELPSVGPAQLLLYDPARYISESTQHIDPMRPVEVRQRLDGSWCLRQGKTLMPFRYLTDPHEPIKPAALHQRVKLAALHL